MMTWDLHSQKVQHWSSEDSELALLLEDMAKWIREHSPSVSNLVCYAGIDEGDQFGWVAYLSYNGKTTHPYKSNPFTLSEVSTEALLAEVQRRILDN